MNMKEAKEALIERGWKGSQCSIRGCPLFYKQHDTDLRCCCNDDKPGIQVTCELWERENKVSFELEVCGERPNGTWVKFRLYSLPEDLDECLGQIPTLLNAWEAAHKGTS